MLEDKKKNKVMHKAMKQSSSSVPEADRGTTPESATQDSGVVHTP